ncbi:hypothetical protein ACO2Q7_13610 [Rathayibacter sp. KR2-224]|uniref:hypothetical protein n=1 Tax=Rathayibacter sp. KR2-224 TaxID=3400913 RepID=UPI003C02041E
MAEPSGRVQIQILTEQKQTAGWFDAEMFETSDTSIPPNWAASIVEGGLIELAPARWTARGFWELYYDGDPQARRVFDEELCDILRPSPQTDHS